MKSDHSQDELRAISDGRFDGLPLFDGPNANIEHSKFPLPSAETPRILNISANIPDTGIQDILDGLLQHYSSGKVRQFTVTIILSLLNKLLVLTLRLCYTSSYAV